MSKSAEVFLLNRAQVDHYWPQIALCLDENPSLWNKMFTKEGLFEDILSGGVQVWVICSKRGEAIQTVFLTQVLSFEVGRTLHIFWMWGKDALEAMQSAALAMEKYARAAACTDVMITGREGWRRALAPFGVTFEGVLLRKELPPVDVRRN